MDFSAQEAKYGKLRLGSAQQTTAPTPQAKKKRGGISGFLEGAARSFANPFSTLIADDIVNPLKTETARYTHNKEAFRNASKKQNEDLGLGESGTEIANAFKKTGGNAAEALLTLTPAKASIIKNAKIGAGFGTAEAVKQKDSTLNDAISGALTGGATGGALGFLGKLIPKRAASSVETTAPKAGGFMKNLTTQGEQMQARGIGASGGAKVTGKPELFPQDTERILDTLNKHEIPIRNANTTARDVGDKLNFYGKQIADHFNAHDAPLHKEDVDKLGQNFLEQLHTTDPRVVKEAEYLVKDLDRDVKSTKGVWDFRKTLDSKTPDSKQGNTLAVSSKIAAIKDMRQYLANELGDVPGMSGYHELSEVKPYLAKGMRELNQPSGGVAGRILSSGPIQKTEAVLGKGFEKAGNIGSREAPQLAEEVPTNILDKVLQSRGIPVKFEESTYRATPKKDVVNKLLTDSSSGELSATRNALQEGGYNTKIRGYNTPSRKSFAGPNVFEPGKPATNFQIRGERTTLPFEQEGTTSRGIIHTEDVYKQIEALPLPPEVKQSLLDSLAEHLPTPSRGFLGNLVTQSAVRGVTPTGEPQAEQPAIADESAIEQPTEDTPEGIPENDPFSSENLRRSVAKILQDGGDMKDVASFLDTAKTLSELTAPAKEKTLNSTQQQQANNANSGIDSLNTIANILKENPNAAKLSHIPGGSLASKATHTGEYKAAVANATDVVGRLRSGGAINKDEEKRFLSLLPGAFDDESTISYKLNSLYSLFSRFADPNNASTSDAQEALAQAGL